MLSGNLASQARHELVSPQETIGEASQARHKSVSPKVTFASRIVVAECGAGISGNWLRKWLAGKEL